MKKRILTYIPCHIDFDEALRQGQFLRLEFAKFLANQKDKNQELRLVLSVNAFSPTNEQISEAKEVFDEVLCYSNSYLADVNISQGFLVALQYDYELFWLLSANDKLTEGTLERVLNEFYYDQTLDLVVLDKKGPAHAVVVHDLELINGLISGVVYRTNRTRQFFNTGPFFPWTGWSHLAVLAACIKGNNGLKIKAIREEVFIQANQIISQNGIKYVHSFYGSLIQNVLFLENRREVKKYLRGFVRQNFFLVHLYSQRDSISLGNAPLVDPLHYMSWNSLLAESILKSQTPVNYLFYLLMKKVPFERFQDIVFFQSVHRYITEKNQSKFK
jgi:hypothetical protein